MILSIQLYTVRDETAKDFAGTLEKLAGMGYKGVEFAGYGSLTASSMKALLDRLGLKAVGSHIRMSRLMENLDEEIEYNLEIGNPYIVCPRNDYKDLKDYMEAAGLYNRIGEKCRVKGLEFCYHNHAHEYQKLDGEYGLDIIYKNTDPELVKAEIDVAWVHKAGLDPASYISKYPGRCPLIHLKDRKAGEEMIFAEIGEGIVSFGPIVSASKEVGAKHFIIEQDKSELPSLDCARVCFDNLKNMNLL